MKISGKLKSIIGTAAPVLGAALGGPLGGLAGNVISQALGVDSEQQAMALIEKDPNALVSLKQAEIEFEKRMRELDIDLERLHSEDRQSARQMAIATSLKPQIYIGTFYLGGYFSVLAYILYLTTHGAVIDETVRTLMAAFGVGVPIVLQFFFGSSAGSKEKTGVLAGRG